MKLSMIGNHWNHIENSFRRKLLTRLFSNDVSVPSHTIYGGIIPKIGLEVHAQLNLNSKLFSDGSTTQKFPNRELDLLDVAIPGSLPKLNRDALRSAILTGIGLNCSMARVTNFDRKNYFYSDMPAGYQITQRNNPIGVGGYVEFIAHTYHKSVISHSQPYDLVKYLFFDERKKRGEFIPYIKRSRIRQIQLEQDSAKTLYEVTDDEESDPFTFVDYNRAGVALLEIVFEPDLDNHHEATSLVQQLIIILKSLNTCDCKMANGSLRVDANVSLQYVPGHGNFESERVELKNIRSVDLINRAILSEIRRQSKVVEQGGVISRQTRFFDEKSGLTKPLRMKEDTIDYRYVPEPNIPPLVIDETIIDSLKHDLPSLMPDEERAALINRYNLDLSIAADVVKMRGLPSYLLKVMNGRDTHHVDTIADFILYTIKNLREMKHQLYRVDLEESGRFVSRLDPKTMGIIIDLMINDEISYTTGYELAKLIFMNNDDKDPRGLVQYHKWQQIVCDHEIDEFCRNLIEKMKGCPKKYSKRGGMKELRMMLDKLIILSNGRISIKKSIKCLNEKLQPPNKSEIEI